MSSSPPPAEPPPSATLLPPHPAPHAGRGTGARLWLVRHAEVHEEWEGRAYGDLDVPLSDGGAARTLEMGREFGALPLDLVLASPLQRARRLGAEVARVANAELVEEDGLREVNRGRWQGRDVTELHEACADEVRDFYADPWGWAGHGGEHDEAIATRAWSAVERGLERVGDGTLLVATHYNVIRVLVASALGVPPVRSFAVRIDLGRAVGLVDAPEGWRLEGTNLVSPPTRRGDR